MPNADNTSVPTKRSEPSPNPSLLVTTSVPLATVVPPEKLLVPVRVSVPALSGPRRLDRRYH